MPVRAAKPMSGTALLQNSAGVVNSLRRLG